MDDNQLRRACARLIKAAQRIDSHFTQDRHGFLSSEDARATELRNAAAALERAISDQTTSDQTATAEAGGETLPAPADEQGAQAEQTPGEGVT
jgi:hypothetical protein